MATANRMNTRYVCKKCERSFMASETAMRVKCPHCEFLNVFVEEPEKVVPPWVDKEIPIYTPEEASARAQALLRENPQTTEGWEPVDMTYEGIDSCFTKAIALNQNKENVYATKVIATISATAKQIFEAYWDPRSEMQWNAGTCTKIQILHDDFTNQLVLQQQKKLVTVNLQNDIAYRRFWEESHKQMWVYCVSEKTKPESQEGWVRGLVVLGGFLIETIAADRCKVSLIWSFDINKKLSVHFKDEEPKKVALRLCKLKKKIEDEARLAMRTQAYEAQKIKTAENANNADVPSGTVNGCTMCKREIVGKNCTSCGKPTFQCCVKCFAVATSGLACTLCGNRF